MKIIAAQSPRGATWVHRVDQAGGRPFGNWTHSNPRISALS